MLHRRGGADSVATDQYNKDGHKKMKNAHESIPQDVLELINAAVIHAVNLAGEIKSTQDKPTEKNNFAKAEKVLYTYPKLKKIASDKEKYMDFEFHGRSSSVTKVSSGQPYKDREDIQDEILAKRASNYEKLLCDIEWIESILAAHEEEKGYVAVRMYYFNEDVNGQPRCDQEKYTWEDIAWEIGRDAKTVRRWRNEIVGSIAACLFGVKAI